MSTSQVSEARALRENRLARAALALLTPFAATALLWLSWGFFKPHVWFVFYPAVFFSAWIGGRWLGLAATTISTFLAWWIFLRPDGSLAITPGSLVAIGVFFITAVSFAYFHDRFRTAISALAARNLVDAEQQAMARLHEIGSLFLSERRHLEPVLAKILDAAIEFSDADFGNIQLVDRTTGDLKIVIQRGFSTEWLDFWSAVATGHGACGTALERGERVVVENVEKSPIFVGNPALAVQLKQGVHAVQSTPLYTRSGKPIGMFSTHFRKPGRPTARQLRLLDLLGRQAADMLELWGASETTAEALHASVRANDELKGLVTAEQRRLEEQKFLSDVSAALQASLDYRMTVERIARCVVSFLGDSCAIDLFDRNETLQRSVVIHLDPKEAALAGVIKDTAPAPSRPDPVWRVADTRQSLVVQKPCALMLVPFIARDRLLGVLSVASYRLGAQFSKEQVQLAEEVARRASLALESAQLYGFAQEAIQARELILGVVAHELRNPLAAIRMQASLLPKGWIDPERRGKSAAVIERAAARMNRLIEDILDVTRMDTGQLSIERCSVAPAQVVADAVEGKKAVATGASLDLRLEVQGPLPEVWADRDRLLQVLENLIGNAIKFTPAGGSVSVGAAPGDREALFWVTDTGPGINPEDVPQLFNRFWQGKNAGRQGAGLGLPIVKGIVEAHGGRIWVETTQGHGASFFFTIPKIVGELKPARAPMVERRASDET